MKNNGTKMPRYCLGTCHYFLLGRGWKTSGRGYQNLTCIKGGRKIMHIFFYIAIKNYIICYKLLYTTSCESPCTLNHDSKQHDDTVNIYTCTGRGPENIFYNVEGGTKISRKSERGYENFKKHL